MVVSRLRQHTFRDHDRHMKNRHGYRIQSTPDAARHTQTPRNTKNAPAAISAKPMAMFQVIGSLR
jgi:hypothetical protein